MVATSLVNLLLFRPPKTRGYYISSRVFYIENALGSRIAVTHVRRKGATITILYSHGNAEDLNIAFEWMTTLSEELDVNVIGYDYTGYGRNKGEPTETNCNADIEAVFDYLVNDQQIAPEQIVLYGRSLGTGPSSHLASKTALDGRSVAGLILHSPFMSVFRIFFDVGYTLSFLGDQFPNIDHVAHMDCPVCIIHGRQDEIIPISHAEALYEALPQKCKAKPFFAENMTHNYHDLKVEVDLMRSLNDYLDYHILARRLWMKPRKRHCRAYV